MRFTTRARAGIASTQEVILKAVSSLTVLAVGDPAASYLKPLARLADDARLIITGDRDEIRRIAPEADVLLNGDFRDPTLFFEAFHQARVLRWAHTPSAGIEKILSVEIVSSPVLLTNGRGLFARQLGEWILAVMLFFTYELRRCIKNQEARRWQPYEHAGLHGRTLAVIGYGANGRAAADRARALGMNILTIDRGERETIASVLAQCDFAALTLPLTPETRGMIGAAEIAAMKPSAVLINVGRGELIDETALIRALQSKAIRGAALDVFTTEPLPPDNPLYSLENVLISPHSADALPTSREDAIQFFVENFERFRKGERLQNVVDKNAGF
jgi:phosphoglycerate dehydrogenase-like enzyme